MNQTVIDTNDRFTIQECEFLYKHFKQYSDKTAIVKDEYGFWTSIFYSEDFLKNKLKCSIIKK